MERRASSRRPTAPGAPLFHARTIDARFAHWVGRRLEARRLHALGTRHIHLSRLLTPPVESLSCRPFFPTTTYETHLSALEAHAQAPVWFPRADEDQERSRHSFAPPPEGPQ